MNSPEADGNRHAATATDRAFFDHLRDHGPTSRAAIASAIGISRPTASESAHRLLGRGFIHEAGISSGARGRSAVLYEVPSDIGHSATLSLSGAAVRLSAHTITGGRAVDLEELLAEQDSPRELTEVVTRLLDDYRAAMDSPCLGLTVSHANPIDRRTGEVHPLPGAPFAAGHVSTISALVAGISEHIIVDNDANWGVLAELDHGCAQHADDVLLVHLGKGIGAAFTSNRQLMRGGRGFAGEIGYLQLEGVTLMERIHQRIHPERSSPSLDSQLLAGAIRAGNTDGTWLVDTLAETITNTAITVDPELIILTGTLLREEGITGPLTAALESRLLFPGVQILSSTLGSRSPHSGAEQFAHQFVMDELWREG